ncbi:hypothetical protein [Nonomuraea sp. NPDC049784]|uniref:hypothetical protein n=1 Tax=Nonomuraea sp. NPDC049784 TaxID=3154361 RepID=UPI0033CE7199
MTGVLREHDPRPDRAESIGFSASNLPISHHIVVLGHLPRLHLRDLDQVTLISSVPMWAEQGVSVRTSSGRIVALADLRRYPLGEPVREVLLEDLLTTREQEACLNLPALGASVARHIPATTPVLQRVHVPDAATVLPLVDEAAHGNVSAGLLRELCKHAADRQRRLSRLFTRRWHASAAARRPVQVELAFELEAVTDRLGRALARGRIPSADSLVQAAERQDPLWRQLVQRLRPTRASDLSTLASVAARLRAARSTVRGPRLAVAIDTFAQYPMGRRAQEVRTLLRGRCHRVDYPMIGLYMRSGAWPLGVAHRAQLECAHELRWRTADEADRPVALTAEAGLPPLAVPGTPVSSQLPGAQR